MAIALTVDHGLNPDSAGWTDLCRETAGRLGVGFQALAWTGEKPASGLPAAAPRRKVAALPGIAGARDFDRRSRRTRKPVDHPRIEVSLFQRLPIHIGTALF